MIVREVHRDKAQTCRSILEALPEWFGLPEATDSYVAESESLLMLGAFDADICVGILTLKETSDHTLELHVMGVLPDRHRRGIGRQLVTDAQSYAKRNNFSYLSVKTLGPSHKDANYEKTRKFYKAMGFVEIEEFKGLWPDNYPCLLMAKFLP